MTLIVAVILTKVRICILQITVIMTKVRIYRFLTITPIPDQVRNDGTAVVILMKIRICFTCQTSNDSDFRQNDVLNNLTI